MNAGLKNAGRWIAIADRDLAAAVMLVEDASDIAAFHLQQATEKYLKAFLTLHGETLRKSHDVSALLLRCIAVDGSFASLASVGDPSEMTAFAAKYRYPNEDEQEFPASDEIASAQSRYRQTQVLVKDKFAEFARLLPPNDD